MGKKKTQAHCWRTLGGLAVSVGLVLGSTTPQAMAKPTDGPTTSVVTQKSSGQKAGQNARAQNVTAVGDVIITELMVDGSGGTGQFIELYNTTSASIDIKNWVLKGNRTVSVTILRNLVIPAKGYAVLGPDRRTGGGIPLDYAYSQTLYLSSTNSYELQLLKSGALVDSVTYVPGTWPISAAASMQLDPDFLTYTSNDSVANWCLSTSPILGFEPILGTPGEPNDLCGSADPDDDGDGYTIGDGDCDDTNAAINPGAAEVCDSKDNDCDDLVDEGVTTVFYKDNDKDTYGSNSSTVELCSAPTGYVSRGGDCNDNDAKTYPGATETCDSLDNDCDGVADDGLPKTRYYADFDSDTYGDSATFVDACAQPFGYVTRGGDCDDSNAGVNPGATETCDTLDNNCNGTVDEGVGTVYYADKDGDTYGDANSTKTACSKPTGYVTNSTDCNDNNPNIKPGATETCNSIDDNCNGTVDEGVTVTYYKDADGDGYGNPTQTATGCTPPTGYVTNKTDCDDTNAAIKPGATEQCNGKDDDCDGVIDDGVTNSTWYQDLDNDGYGNSAVTKSACSQPVGYVSVSGDCNDNNAAIKPGATETCNAVDDNCNGTVDEGVKTNYYIDADNDTYGKAGSTPTAACTKPTGYVANNSDCDDTKSTVYPGATEQCNGIDDNCNTQVDEGVTNSTWYQDLDGDTYGNPAVTKSACSQPTGYVSNSSDCNDADATIKPGATETCNSKDDNCNGTVDEGVGTTWYRDADGDTYGSSTTTTTACTQPTGYVSNSSDCNDADATIKPGATETCNSKDDDCDGVIDDGAGTTWYIDGDNDGYGVSTTTKVACTKPSGYAAVSGDCNDANGAIYPTAPEQCNQVDDDCDGTIDDGVTNSTWYRDVDGDNYGISTDTKSACSKPTGYVAQSGDCNDADATVNPGAAEVCNTKDDDCDAQVDEGVTTTWYRDADGDTYGTTATTTQACTKPTGYVSNSTDCNDASATVYPGATETCNSVDDNCNSQIDEGLATSTYYQDSDNDGYGNTAVTKVACSKPTGYVATGGDCNDTNAAIKPGATEVCNSIDDDCDGVIDDGATAATWYRDVDGDGYGTSTTTTTSCTQPTGYVSNSTDCNDANAAIKPGATEIAGDSVDQNCDGAETCFKDADNDGYRPDSTSTVASTDSDCADANEAISTDPTGDCNDANASIKPGATELCNSIDDDCDGTIDDGVTSSTWYRDVDGDGYGTSTNSTTACSQPTGYVSNSTDCNDANAAIKPGATEIAGDSVDQNCDGAETCYKDADNDGYRPDATSTVASTDSDCADANEALATDPTTDCNDASASINPGATEQCNSVDDDCDGQIDDGVTNSTWYRDVDGDGYGTSATTTSACSQPTGYVSNSTDCNDANAAIKPGATEVAGDSVDQNCDGAETCYKDADNDGYRPDATSTVASTDSDCGDANEATNADPTTDCNDANASIKPGATELCNSIDDDCDGVIDDGVTSSTWYRDADGDGYGTSATSTTACTQPTGYVSNSTDCNDASAAIKPGATEIAGDSVDQNCDGAETCYKDADNDGYRPDATSTVASTDTDCADANEAISTDPTTDCNDASATINPGATEQCNSIDDDCDGAIDDGVTNSTWYRDVDGDGYGTATTTTSACSQPTGYVSNSTDCNDANAAIKPGATEIAGDSVDQNCDGAETCFKDADNDGYRPDSTSTVASTDTDCADANEAISTDPTGDCNDTNASIKPGATETCNSIDDDCDGVVDDGATAATWYRDVDGDGYGTSATTTTSCTQPTGYVSNSTDCNDANAAIKPGATEIAGDSVDQNCDGAETCFKDADNDGYRPDSTSTVASTDTDCADANEAISTDPTGDCNDANAAIKPGATELCNSIDDDCDGVVDDGATAGTWYRDADGDTYGTSATTTTSCTQPTGYVSNSSDCNDSNAAIKPGATEIAGDSVDQNCDGAETCFKDADNDGYRPDSTSTVASSDTDCADANEAISTDPTGDCNDADAAIKPGATELCNSIDDDCDGVVDDGATAGTWYRDADGDTYGTSATTTTSCTQPTGYVSNSSDCNDSNAAIKPGATEIAGDSVDQNCDGAETCFKDADNDGYRPDSTSTVASSDTDCADANEAISTDPTGDCNDTNAAIKPGATETCNSIDDDCDGVVDDGATAATWYRDADGDTYGTSATTTTSCTQPTGYVSNSTDCNDTNAAIKPGATEIAGDSVDQNCDGAETCFKDADNDGYRPDSTSTVASTDADCADANEATSTDPTGDCNDANAAIKPGATETCNSIDDDCDGVVDDGAAATTWYRDADGDGYGTSATTTSSCTQPTGYVSNSTDCNDANAAVKPGATETCNGVDDNCNGSIDEGTSASTWYKDADGDGKGDSTQTTTSCVQPTGYVSVTGDCDDTDADIYTGAPEMCDTKDNDCNGKRDDAIFSGTQPTGYSGTCGLHYMVPVEGMMAAPTSTALSPIFVFETINGSTTSAFLSGTSGADGHVGNLKGTITGSDGSTYTLGACTVDTKIAYRATCAAIAAGTFKANVSYTILADHTQKADGTGWKIRMKGKFFTKSPCGATWNTKPGFKFTKFGSSSSLTLNLMNSAAGNNPIQLGATLVDVPKTATLPTGTFKLALGAFTESAAPFTYRAPYGASAVIPGASLNSTGVLSLPQGNVAVPTPATSTTVSFMFTYDSKMTGTITTSGNLTTWSSYQLTGIVTKKDMDLFFSDSGNSLGVSYDISNYTPPGGVAQGPAANVIMTATPGSVAMSTAVCP